MLTFPEDLFVSEVPEGHVVPERIEAGLRPPIAHARADSAAPRLQMTRISASAQEAIPPGHGFYQYQPASSGVPVQRRGASPRATAPAPAPASQRPQQAKRADWKLALLMVSFFFWLAVFSVVLYFYMDRYLFL